MAYTTAEYVQAIKAAEEAGDTNAARTLTQAMAESMRAKPRGAMATAMHGATLGLSSALVPGARQMVEEYREERPGAALGLEMLGGLGAGAGVGTGAALAGRLRGPAGAAGRWLSQPRVLPQATLGGAEAGVLGASEAEPGERGMGAAMSAVPGALLGGLSPAISGALTRRFAPGREAERMVQTELGADLGRTPRPVDYTRLAERSLTEPERTLAELSGPAAEMQAITSRNIGGRARGIAEEAVESRRQGMQSRLMASLGENIGTEEGFTAASKRLEKQARADATPLYKAAYDAPFTPDDELIALTQGSERRKLLKAGYNRAKQSEGIRTGEELPTWGALVSDEGEGLESLTLAQWDQIKRGMDDQYKTIVRKNPSLARDLWDYRQQVVGKLDELAPDEYRQARAAWAGPKAQEEALEEGSKVFRQDAEYITDLMQSYSQAERDAFIIGAAQEVRNKLKSVPPEGGMPRFTDLALERIRAAFPSDEAFDELWRTITSERDMQRFRNLVVAGSQTAANLAGQERAGRLLGAARGVGEAMGGQPVEGARTILGNLMPRQAATLPERINDPLAKMLFARGPAIPGVLQRLQRPAVTPSLLGPMTTTQAAILANEARRRLTEER